MRADVDIEIENDNAMARAEFIAKFPMYRAHDLRSFYTGKPPKSPHDPAARWKREGRIFAVTVDGIDHFPAFQFTDGAQIPAVMELLSALPSDMSPWQTAFWFVSENGWLGGKAPKDCLAPAVAVDEAIEAARRLGSPAMG